MARMLPAEGEAAYRSGARPPYLLVYDPPLHREEMEDVATGAVGAALRTGVWSVSGPEVGSRIPIVVCNIPGDLLRIFVDPIITPYKRKARQYVKLAALNYRGDDIKIDTYDMSYTKYEELALELIRQQQLFDSLPRPPSH